MSIYQNILNDFNDNLIDGKTIKQIFEFYNATKGFEKDAVRSGLNALEKDCKIAFVSGRYVLFDKAGFIKGVIQGNEKGYAFLIREDGESDLFLPNKNLNGANHGDTVFCKKVEYSSRGSNDEAEVVKIITRGITELVGTFVRERSYGFVIADEKNYYNDIFVADKNTAFAKTGDKVLVKIIDFSNGKNPEGKITEVIGRQYDLLAEEISIIKNHGLTQEFSQKIKDETSKISQKVDEKDTKDRLDLRNKRVFTIDGDDSRDFDDAVSIEINEKGNYILGVHIADVTHYVKENSCLDKEAYNRGNSVYFPDRVIPMLPEELSNGICSLNEKQDRLIVSCIMEIDKNGEITDKEICLSVIRSIYRMTYKKIQGIYDGDENLRKQYKEIVEDVLKMYQLRKILNEKKRQRGSVNLDVKDTNIYLDENGEIQIDNEKEILSRNLIEEFMLIANTTVAEYLYYMELPCVYRIHEKPSEEKLKTFMAFLGILGEKVKWNESNCHPKDFQKLLEKMQGQPYYPVVNKVMLRSMQKAKYSSENKGHFGLSLTTYCHFTSPIRRYSDLTVHRILKKALDGSLCDSYESLCEKVGEISTHCSLTERVADETERQVDDLYVAKYMIKYKGYEAEGIISGVTDFGIFVELGNGVEGIVRLDDMPKGRYIYDEKAFKLYSNKNSYTLGERVNILVAGVDLRARKVEFILLNKVS